jgi:hypothetical protein
MYRILKKRYYFLQRFHRNHFFLSFKKKILKKNTQNLMKKTFSLKKNIFNKTKFLNKDKKKYYFTKTDINLFILLFTSFMDAKIYIGKSSI